MRDSGRLEDRLLGFLHVFVVGERKSLEQQRDRLCCAVKAADFGADEFGEVGIFLLRHGARAGGEGLGQLDEAELGGRVEGDLLGEAAGVEAEHGERLQVFEDEVAVAGCVHAVGGGRGEVEFAGGDGAVEFEGCAGDCA